MVPRCCVVLSIVCVCAVTRGQVTIRVDAAKDARPISRYLTGACIEDVNHEIYGGIYSQMIFGESFQEPATGKRVPKDQLPGLSGMWSPAKSGDAVLDVAIEKDRPFVGTQSQRVTFASGSGEVGIANAGLNRWGTAFAGGKPYEGYVWIRAEKPVEVVAALENHDGSRAYAKTKIAVSGDEWKRYDFALTPDADEANGRFSLRLAAPGSFVVGHAFLQAGEWGRFKGLPVRRDVVEGLIDQGVTVLRYGGSLVNHKEYRWKKMIGPRDRRPPYRGTWYPYSSNGWGIIDFLSLCEAAGFMPIPDFCADETPQDMADFIEYVNGPADSEWGRRRAEDGHPAPFNLTHFEFGNEEKVDEAYWQKVQGVATAVWAKDPKVVIVVGDFQYERPITDPFHFEGAASKITTLAAHQKILELAKKNGREVWFDVHLWTERPGHSSVKAFPTYLDAIDKLADGAAHHVVVFEFNANKHDQRRAVANAAEIVAIMRDGRVPVALSANGLQPDGQNDNGWDQGLLFLNPSKVWLQPPGYVTQMFSRGYQSQGVEVQVEGGGDQLTATAARSEDGKRLVVYVVNTDAKPIAADVRVEHFDAKGVSAKVEVLSGAPTAVNTADAPTQIAPKHGEWKVGDGQYEFQPSSVTVMTIE